MTKYRLSKDAKRNAWGFLIVIAVASIVIFLLTYHNPTPYTDRDAQIINAMIDAQKLGCNGYHEWNETRYVVQTVFPYVVRDKHVSTVYPCSNHETYLEVQ